MSSTEESSMEPQTLTQPSENGAAVSLDPFASIPDGPVKFEGAEHRSIGDSITLEFNGIRKRAADLILHTVHQERSRGLQIDLTFGKVIGLAGDFYTNYNARVSTWFDTIGYPISWGDSDLECEARFERAFNSLIEDKGDYLKNVQDLLEKEKGTLDGLGAGEHDSFAKAYHDQYGNIPTDKQFAGATSTNTFAWGVYLIYYAKIAWINIDHFGIFAVKAYQTGHKLALSKAIDAGRKNPKDEKGLKMENGLEDASGLVYRPIWDIAARRMHDEDSATGLFVANAEGKKWIAYGDKQFFNGHNRVSRALAIDALQASADEIGRAYRDGTRPNVDAFLAIKKTPIPIENLSERIARMAGNPPPLWANDEEQKLKWQDAWDSTKWSRRQNLNDHSDYRRIYRLDNQSSQGYPGYEGSYAAKVTGLYASESAKDVDRADFFRGDGSPNKRVHPQFPNTDFMEPLGGFHPDTRTKRKRQELPAPYEHLGPVSLTIDQQTVKTFTLRQKWTDFYRLGIDNPSLSWLSYTQGKKTSVINVRLDRPNQKVLCGSWSMTMNNTDNSQMAASIDEMSKFTYGNSDFYNAELLTSIKSYQDLAYTRFFVNTFVPGSTESSPCIMSAGLYKNPANGIWSFHASFVATSANFTQAVPRSIGKDFPLSGPDDISTPTGYFKSIRIRDNSTQKRIDQHYLLYLRAYFNNDRTIWTLNPYLLYAASDADSYCDIGPRSVMDYGEGATDKARKEGDFTLLVGDLGRGSDQFVAFGHKCYKRMVLNIGEYTKISQPPNRSTNLTMTQITCNNGAGAFPAFQESDLLFPYMSALLPNETAGTSKTLALIMFQCFKKGNQIFTWIRTCFSVKGQNPLTSCVDCTILDDLTSGMGDNFSNYKPIAWFRTKVMTKSGAMTENGVLQIFSWYGMLGSRVFAPYAPGNYDKWVLTGQTPMMGQTAVGTGYGNDGLWNQGMIPMGQESSFVDMVQLTNPNGTFQMGPGDALREKVYGWEVEKRGLWEKAA